MERLTLLYEDYLEQLQRFKKKMKPADGIFGIGLGLGDAPCHDDFAEKLEVLLGDMAADASFQDSRTALEFVYRAPLQEQEKAAYWMMMAVHKLTLPLIDRLDRQDAGTMLEWYKEAYPRKDRLPPQNMVLKALKKAAGDSLWGKKKGRLFP